MDNFFLLFFIPIIMVVFGFIFWKFTPKKNRWFGYRTRKSLLNEDTWDYANKTCGLYWFIAGIIELIVSIIIFCVSNKADSFKTLKIINIAIDIAFMLMVIPYTEIKLKRKFFN